MAYPQKPTILAVDDTPGNLLALEAVLGDEYNVVRAQSGMEAISQLQTRYDVDVILMDVHMPRMDGFETAEHIKRLRHYRDVPIVFITAVYKEDEYVKRGYKAGGIDYFGKPFDPEILKLKVGIYATFRHRTEVLKERERNLRASEELLRAGQRLSAVLENLPVGVLIADMEGRICQTTEEVSRILKAVEPLESDAYGEVLGWWDAEGRLLREAGGPLIRALQKGESSHSERMLIRCFDRTAKTILVSASPLRAIDSRIVGAVILVQDITESREIAIDLENRVTKLVTLGVELEHDRR
jgi:response regulator RpfG family c-di-GMP phosphodiesterase